MAKIIKEAHNPDGVSRELKKEFFEKLRDLCCEYGVFPCAGTIDFPKHLKTENSPKEIPAIFFEFYDGSNYIWSDGELDYANCNSFENEHIDGDIITINGVDFSQKASKS